MKKAFVCSNNASCQRNLLDEHFFKSFFMKNGFDITDKPQDAELILFNTCAFTSEREEDCISTIRKLSQIKRKDARFIVCGCLPGINRKRLTETFKGQFFGHHEINKINDIIGSKKNVSDVPNNYIQLKDHPTIWLRYKAIGCTKLLYHLLDRHLNLNPALERLFFSDYDWTGHDKRMFHIKISEGCLNNCTFCTVKYAKGSLKSKAVSVVLDEFRRGLNEGYRRFMLVAEDVGNYGVDICEDLTSLLKSIFAIPGEYKICFNNLHPKWLILMQSDLMPLFKTGKIDGICMPVQSGSDRILSLMGRGYDILQFKKAVYTIRKKAPSINIKTHLMVGFPDETDKDFKDTMILLDEIDFDDIAVFEYSSRPGTVSSRMINQIPEPIKRKRYRLLKLKAAFNKRLNKIRLSIKPI